MPPLISDTVAARWIATHGEVARQWVEAAPELARRWASTWGLALEGSLPGGSVSLVLAARRDGEAVVLKLAVPWSAWSSAEAAALRTWNGTGAPRLLEASDDARALLLERIVPGTPAESLDTKAVAELLLRLSSRTPALPLEIPRLAEAVVTRFQRAEENRHGLIDAARLARARAAALSMTLEDHREFKLLHGDFLTKNLLLSASRGVVAIDPNPAFGDTCYDVGQWSITERPIAEAPKRCSALARHLGLDPARAWAWALALGTVEICLASEERAKQTLAVVADADPEWW